MGLFEDDVAALECSMPALGTSSAFLSCIVMYLRHKGTLRFQDIVHLPPDWKQYATEQDAIGWDNFLIGMVGSSIHSIVRCHLVRTSQPMTAEDWIRLLIKKLLRITHRQWLYRNAVVHSLMHDGLTRIDQRHVFSQIIRQFRLGSEGLLPEDKGLLDVDMETLWSKNGLQKKY